MKKYNKLFIEQALIGYEKICSRYRGMKKFHDLFKRKYSLNKLFFSNIGNILRIEEINSWLQTKMQTDYIQAEQLEIILLQNMQQKSSFISDYEIEFNLQLYASKKYAKCKEMEGYPFLDYDPHISFRKQENNCSEEIEGHKQWLLNQNHNEYQFDEVHPLKLQHHCYLLHDLYDQTYLAWQDIIDTEMIWFDIVLKVQNCSRKHSNVMNKINLQCL
jgi:hypothetical protein